MLNDPALAAYLARRVIPLDEAVCTVRAILKDANEVDVRLSDHDARCIARLLTEVEGEVKP
jgi:hypothetical protein